jgi:hypothetical protein
MTVTMEDFVTYHAKNPKVWELFRDFALLAIEKGRKKLGAKMVMERIRWYTTVEARDKCAGFKINNNYTSYYVRMFEEAYPQHKDVFEKRESIADR